jgi:alpha-tubulin suppressor-like RCC1 family protein
MALTKTVLIADGAVTSNTISENVALGIKIANVSIANSGYSILDDTAVNTAGGYIVVTGAGFKSGAIITIGDTNATTTTFVNSTTLRAQVPAKDAATYTVYVTNTDGSVGLRINGLTYSNTPVWGTGSTLDNQAVDTAFAVNLSANSDSAVTYANTTTLPAGTSLLSNGYFYGTVTGIAEETTYTFTIEATDAENQENFREFSVTVTVGPGPGQLWTWGPNNYGQLGINSTVHKSSPIQVGSLSDWQDMATASETSAAVKSNGTLWTWGYGLHGQLANELPLVNISSPVQIGSSTDWSSVIAGSEFFAALKTNGTLWVWGRNDKGQLGLNDILNRSSPTQVGTDTNWNNISMDSSAVATTKTDGTAWLWGDNADGRLGLNSTTHRSSPTQLGSGTDWHLARAFNPSLLLIKNDGTLWTSGYNGEGQLGLNDILNRSSPVQVGTATDWYVDNEKIGTGQYIHLIKNDGTLWTWGRNIFGSLGLSDKLNRSSPTQVGSSTDWSTVTSGYFSVFSLKTNGSLWSWGFPAGLGALGLNDQIYRSSPVQVGTDTNWSRMSTSQNNFYGLKILKSN